MAKKKTFEYTRVLASEGNAETAIENLNLLGADGWEMVFVSHSQAGAEHWILMREVDD